VDTRAYKIASQISLVEGGNLTEPKKTCQIDDGACTDPNPNPPSQVARGGDRNFETVEELLQSVSSLYENMKQEVLISKLEGLLQS